MISLADQVLIEVFDSYEWEQTGLFFAQAGRRTLDLFFCATFPAVVVAYFKGRWV